MALTLSDIRSEVRAYIKSTGLATNRIDLWANLAQDELWRELDPEYGIENLSFTTTAALRSYNLPVSINKILSVVDQTNELKIPQVNEAELEKIDPNINDNGNPNYYSLYGLVYVANQPSAASQLSIVSSQAADTTQTVQVMGAVSGIEISEAKTLTGAAPTLTTNSFTTIRRITKSATTAGSVTVTSNAGTVTNIIIPPSRLVVEYQTINFWPIPDGVFTINVRFIRNPIPMRQTYDIPDLPVLWHGTLLNLTTAYGHKYLYEFEQESKIRSLVRKEIQDLKSNQYSKSDSSPVIGKTIGVRGLGRLPSNYPIT